MDKGNEMSRRECLAWLTRASAIALSGFNTCAWAESGERAGSMKIADLIQLASGSVREIENPHVFLSRTNQGIACMSTTCTHRRNQLEMMKNGEIYCPVHGSSFDLEGNPSGGPATRPLAWYLTIVSNDGSISVDISRTVKQGERAELPEWARPKN